MDKTQARHYNNMTPTQLLEATIDARKRKLQGASLAALLIVLDDPVEIGQIAKRIGVSSASMTGISDKLARRGYAFRKTVSGDRRKWNLQISPKGIAAVESILNLK